MQFATLKNLIRTSPTTYHSLSTTDPEKPPSTSPPAPSKPLLPRPLLFALLAILSLPTVVLLTFLSLTFFTHPIPASSPPTHPHDPTAVYPHLSDPRTRAQLLSPLKWNYSTPSPCGHTPHAAQRAGCVFGPTTWAWYPPACYDFALEAEFLRLADWGWYSSEDLADKHRLDREEVLRGEHKVAWMGTVNGKKYHELHCVYSGRKLLRSVLGIGGLADNYVLGMAHERHCEMESISGEKVLVAKGTQKFLNCIRI